MSEQNEKNVEKKEAAAPEAADQAQEAVQPQEEQAESPNPLLEELETLKKNLSDQEDKYLRLAAEYDNYRRRSQKEKESAWADSKAETAAAFLPVYDNLERALKQETADEAFKKGVEMTMTQLKEILAKLLRPQPPQRRDARGGRERRGEHHRGRVPGRLQVRGQGDPLRHGESGQLELKIENFRFGVLIFNYPLSILLKRIFYIWEELNYVYGRN